MDDITIYVSTDRGCSSSNEVVSESQEGVGGNAKVERMKKRTQIVSLKKTSIGYM